jgi:hypothetical protein
MAAMKKNVANDASGLFLINDSLTVIVWLNGCLIRGNRNAQTANHDAGKCRVTTATLSNHACSASPGLICEPARYTLIGSPDLLSAFIKNKTRAAHTYSRDRQKEYCKCVGGLKPKVSRIFETNEGLQWLARPY